MSSASSDDKNMKEQQPTVITIRKTNQHVTIEVFQVCLYMEKV